jgi:voltage-gated potassium channel
LRIHRFLFALCVPVLLVAAGTAGYVLIEGWSIFDALYMTVTTLTTVGFGEVHPLSRDGRTFTMLLLLGGVFTLFYAATEIIRGVVSGEVRSVLGRQRMERNLSELTNHLVVCGFGRMGLLVCREFSSLGLPFVLIERQGERLQNFDIPHGIPLLGDATSDETLRRAGVERARGLVSAAASDADNLYITMSARFLSDRLFIVARAEEEGRRRSCCGRGPTAWSHPTPSGASAWPRPCLGPM